MPKPKNRTIANQLRKYRRARGLKQRQAARILGFADASSLSRWEKGVCLPSGMNMLRLAALYRVLVDALWIDTLRMVRDEVCKREAEVLGSGAWVQRSCFLTIRISKHTSNGGHPYGRAS
jgi:transcriptional regulator with XRE-family HTH domain